MNAAHGIELEELAKLIASLNIGPNSPFPLIDTQDLSFDLLNNIRNHSSASVFVFGTDLADHVRFISTEEYFAEHGENVLYPWADISPLKSGRAAGYVGMIMGLEVYSSPDIPPNMILGVNKGNTKQAAIGYVKI